MEITLTVITAGKTQSGRFYDRQLNILTSVSMAQSQVVDGGTGNAIRELPYLDKMTEPRVISILGLEMVTLGHLLSDLCNLKSPYSLELVDYKCMLFHPDIVPGLPTRDGCIGRYKEDAGWEPAPDMLWGTAFSAFRSSVVMQGIAARSALIQASSA
ncbi:hypothetical protein ETB97_009412 [Aspergillus alliaceus]|uniref:Uncharacterized protein n=1 Tax=Petromyces alliaceus TaxID=209559 RepID=A0A8H6E8U8_PETAA|nr:hypothetical protein ETB97_009412 [Aspergillus burnettii]